MKFTTFETGGVVVVVLLSLPHAAASPIHEAASVIAIARFCMLGIPQRVVD